MIVGFAGERPHLPDDAPCVFDTLDPYVTFEVVDPGTRRPVANGERGRVVAHHVSRSFLLPNNLERDLATRVMPPEGGIGTRSPTSHPSTPSRTRRSSRGSTDAGRT